MGSTILLLTTGFAAGVIFITFAGIVLLAIVLVILKGKVDPAAAPSLPKPPAAGFPSPECPDLRSRARGKGTVDTARTPYTDQPWRRLYPMHEL